MSPGCFVDFAQAFDQAALVHGPDLIQDDLAGLPFETKRHACGVRAAFRSHRGDNHGIDVMVHLVRGDDEAGPGLPNFTTLGRVEPDEKDVEPGRYHVQSFRSHLDVEADSRSIC